MRNQGRGRSEAQTMIDEAIEQVGFVSEDSPYAPLMKEGIRQLKKITGRHWRIRSETTQSLDHVGKEIFPR